MHRCLVFFIATLIANATYGFDIDGACKHPWRPAIKALCDNQQFLARARNFEHQYLLAVRQQNTVGELNTLRNLNFQFFSSKYTLTCSPKALSLPRGSEEFLACANMALSELEAAFAARYSNALDVASTNREAALEQAEARIESLERSLMVSLRLCQIEKADELDDNISPASDIAAAVSVSCRRDAEALTKFSASITSGDYLYPFTNLSGVSLPASHAYDMANRHYGATQTIPIVLKRRVARAAEREMAAKEALELERKRTQQQKPKPKTM